MDIVSQTDFFSQKQEPTIYSVGLISKALKDMVEGNFSGIRVKGEVQGLKRHTSGHIYFSLKDNEAVMDGVCWRGTKQTELLREGLEIVAYGKITTYPGRSKYQMIVSSFEASGEGALLQLLQKLKEQLLKEGLFDERFKKKIPTFPKRIGLITSPTGAVLRDIMHRLRERYPCHVLIKPVAVQGDGSAEQVRQAVLLMNALPPENRPDVLIIARGGGSLEDLFAFNDEGLVREVFKSYIPVISAIGHETDYTLLDFVADLRAPTPTAAAELATPVLNQVILRIEEIRTRMSQTLLRHLDMLNHRLSRCEGVLRDPLRYVFEKQQLIDDWAERLHLAAHRFLAQKKLSLGVLNVERRLQHAKTKYFEKLTEKLGYMERHLENVSFKKTLERGFALAQTEDGQVIQSIQDVPATKPFQIHLRDGIAKVQALPSKQGKLF